MSKHIAYRAFVILATVALAIVLLFHAPSLVHRVDRDVMQLDNWEYVTLANEEADPVTLPFSLQWDENGSCVLATRLPEDGLDSRYLCFWTYFSSVKVSIEGESIYQHNTAGSESFGMAPVSHWNYVRLPDDAGGKQILLQIKTPYTDINPRLTEVLYGDLHNLHHWVHQRYYIFRFLDDVLIWIGALFIALAFIQRLSPRYKRYQLFAGFFFFLFSLYLSTGTKALPLEWITPYAQSFLCYFCMFTMAIPLTFYTKAKVMNHRKKMLWCDLLILAEVVVTTVGFLLHTFEVVDIHYTVRYGLLLFLATALTAIVYAVGNYMRKKTVASLLTVAAPVLILLILMAEYLQFYFIGSLPFDTGLISRLGAIGVLLVEGYLFFYQLKQEANKMATIENEHRNLQLQILTDNIRPHFILNTIGAIRTIIPSEPDRAADLLYDFSKYIRKHLEQKDYFKPIPFPEELDYIKTYLTLEQARFGDTIQVHYNCTDVQFRVLPLTVQPFVENAIKHGLFSVGNGGKLWISSVVVPGGHMIEIKDNGVGFDTDRMDETMNSKKAVGMRSAIMRLEETMHATVSITSGGAGTCVRIHIPEEKVKR